MHGRIGGLANQVFSRATFCTVCGCVVLGGSGGRIGIVLARPADRAVGKGVVLVGGCGIVGVERASRALRGLRAALGTKAAARAGHGDDHAWPAGKP